MGKHLPLIFLFRLIFGVYRKFNLGIAGLSFHSGEYRGFKGPTKGPPHEKPLKNREPR
jgi:hypothetical protein